jgi:hypothetical protein
VKIRKLERVSDRKDITNSRRGFPPLLDFRKTLDSF